MNMITYEFILRLFIAAILGGAIGLEREYRAKEAGFRTHFLVALGSGLFMILSQFGFDGVLGHYEQVSLDPSRIASQVVHWRRNHHLPEACGKGTDHGSGSLGDISHRHDRWRRHVRTVHRYDRPRASLSGGTLFYPQTLRHTQHHCNLQYAGRDLYPAAAPAAA